jgi:hypothetical protein
MGVALSLFFSVTQDGKIASRGQSRSVIGGHYLFLSLVSSISLSRCVPKGLISLSLVVVFRFSSNPCQHRARTFRFDLYSLRQSHRRQKCKRKQPSSQGRQRQAVLATTRRDHPTRRPPARTDCAARPIILIQLAHY